MLIHRSVLLGSGLVPLQLAVDFFLGEDGRVAGGSHNGMICTHTPVGVIGGHHVRHAAADVRAVVPAGPLQDLQLAAEGLVVHVDGPPHMDEPVGGILQALLVHQQLLIQLLPRPQTGVDNGDVHVHQTGIGRTPTFSVAVSP